MTPEPSSVTPQEILTEASSVPEPKSGQKILVGILIALMVVGGIGGFWYWTIEQRIVYTDKASVSAPVINLTATIPGILKNVLVRDGDRVAANQIVARVGDEMVRSEISGLVLKAARDIGADYAPGQPIVTMIDPREMRMVARVEEDKGVIDVRPGQSVEFTVDAYGSQTFQGVVESVSDTSRQGDIVFNISDKRQEMEFEVKIAYDLEKNPPFKNGMSAKVWITK